MPPFARLLILRESKKHAILSHTVSPECRLQRGDATGTRLTGRGAVEEHASPLSF
jgi:hypothetical protein